VNRLLIQCAILVLMFAPSADPSSLVAPAPSVPGVLGIVAAQSGMGHGTDDGSAVRASEVAGASPARAGDAVSVGNPTNVKTLARTTPISRGGYLRVEHRDPVTVVTPEPTPEPIDVRAIVAASARRHGVDVAQLLRVTWCESRFDPSAVNPESGAAGALQFMPATWAANSVRYGWPGASPHDPYAASDVAAQMFRDHQSYQWECR